MTLARTAPPALATHERFEFERFTDGNGTLYVAELRERFAVTFSRLFFIAGVPEGGARGGHAHMRQAECLVCAQGHVTVRVEHRSRADVVRLDRAGSGLFLPARHWIDLVEFSSDAVLVVLAEDPFDETDYVRDRAEFRRREASAR